MSATDAETEAAVPDTPGSEVEVDADPHALDDAHAQLLARLEAELGDAVLDRAANFGTPVVRIRRDSWRRAAEFARAELDCDYLCFISAVDWEPAPKEGGDDAGGDTSSPVQPSERTYGVAGAEGRFQVFAHVQSSRKHTGITMKVDIDEDTGQEGGGMLAESWTPVYPGADWHERECWEMFGITFEGHPAIRHLYLPDQFEGHPLRKDFPLLSRTVKPWPGLVDVEPMPEDEEAEAAEGAARATDTPAEDTPAAVDQAPDSSTDTGGDEEKAGGEQA